MTSTSETSSILTKYFFQLFSNVGVLFNFIIANVFFWFCSTENRPFIFGIPNSSGTFCFGFAPLGLEGAAPPRRSHPIGMGLESQRRKKSVKHLEGGDYKEIW